MKILVISDIHGLLSFAENMIEKEKPDEVIFCGDGYRDLKRSAPFYKDVRFHYVGGNCDLYAETDEQCITLGGKNIFFTHGHHYNVKMEKEMHYITLRSRAKEMGADIVLFGHTHRRTDTTVDGIRIFNPGSASRPRDGKPPSFGLIDVYPEGFLTSHGDLKSPHYSMF